MQRAAQLWQAAEQTWMLESSACPELSSSASAVVDSLISKTPPNSIWRSVHNLMTATSALPSPAHNYDRTPPGEKSED